MNGQYTAQKICSQEETGMFLHDGLLYSSYKLLTVLLYCSVRTVQDKHSIKHAHVHKCCGVAFWVEPEPKFKAGSDYDSTQKKILKMFLTW